jgi:hypothetical protein
LQGFVTWKVWLFTEHCLNVVCRPFLDIGVVNPRRREAGGGALLRQRLWWWGVKAIWKNGHKIKD